MTSPNPMKPRYFLGVVSHRHDNWESFYAEPTAPSNYKPETAATYIAKKRKEQEQKADRSPLVSHTVGIVVLNLDGSVLFASSSTLGATVSPTWENSVKFAQFLQQYQSMQIGHDPVGHPNYDIGRSWFGFDIREMMHVIAMDVMQYNSTRGNLPYVVFPVGAWRYSPFTPAPFVDPYELLIPSALQNDVTFDALCDFLKIPIPQDIDVNPYSRAELARRLAIRGQLFPLLPELQAL